MSLSKVCYPARATDLVTLYGQYLFSFCFTNYANHCLIDIQCTDTHTHIYTPLEFRFCFCHLFPTRNSVSFKGTKAKNRIQPPPIERHSERRAQHIITKSFAINKAAATKWDTHHAGATCVKCMLIAIYMRGYVCMHKRHAHILSRAHAFYHPHFVSL